MPNSDQIRPLTEVPDHGHGLLGRLAHSVLAEYAGRALPVPQLHLGQNTLPDPPFPMAAQVPFDDLTAEWCESGADLCAFLELGVRTLRTQPTPDVSAYTYQVRLLQRLLRFDSIALAWELLQPAGGVAALVVDRAGSALAGWIPAGGTVADITVHNDVLEPDDQVIRLLSEVLQAQYTWTATVFGSGP